MCKTLGYAFQTKILFITVIKVNFINFQKCLTIFKYYYYSLYISNGYSQNENRLLNCIININAKLKKM